MRLAVPGRMRGARRRTCSRSDTGTVGSFSAAEPPFSQHCRPACGPLSPCAALWCAVVTAVQPGSRAPEPGNPALRAVRTTVPALRGSVLTALPHFARVITLAKCGIPSRARYRLQNYPSASPPPGRTGTRLQLLRKGLEAAQPTARSYGDSAPAVAERSGSGPVRRAVEWGPAPTGAARKPGGHGQARASGGSMAHGIRPGRRHTRQAEGPRHSQCAGPLRSHAHGAQPGRRHAPRGRSAPLAVRRAPTRRRSAPRTPAAVRRPHGARDGTRTHTSRTLEPKSSASANSATRAPAQCIRSARAPDEASAARHQSRPAGADDWEGQPRPPAPQRPPVPARLTGHRARVAEQSAFS